MCASMCTNVRKSCRMEQDLRGSVSNPRSVSIDGVNTHKLPGVQGVRLKKKLYLEAFLPPFFAPFFAGAFLGFFRESMASSSSAAPSNCGKVA